MARELRCPQGVRERLELPANEGKGQALGLGLRKRVPEPQVQTLVLINRVPIKTRGTRRGSGQTIMIEQG